MYKYSRVLVVLVVGVLMLVSCSNGGGGVMPDTENHQFPDFETDGALSEMIARSLNWDDPDEYVDGSNDNEQRVDATDVRIYSTSMGYTMDVHPCAGDEPTPDADQSLVVVAWEEWDGTNWDVKWAVRYCDASVEDYYWGTVYTVPNTNQSGYDNRNPAVTAYLNLSGDVMTADVVYQKRENYGDWEIHHCRYRQATSENYGSFSLDSTLHPTGASEQVSSGYEAINPDVVWYGRLQLVSPPYNISILHCAFEQDTDGNGGVGDHVIKWTKYVEGNTSWRAPLQMSESNDNYYPEHPRIDAGVVDIFNSGDPLAATVWHNQV